MHYLLHSLLTNQAQKSPEKIALELKEELARELGNISNYAGFLSGEEELNSVQLEELIEKVHHLHDRLIGLKYISAYDLERKVNAEEEDTIEQPPSPPEEEQVEELMPPLAETENIEEEEATPEDDNMHEEQEEVLVEEPIEEPEEIEVQAEENEANTEQDLNETFSSSQEPSLSGQLGKQPITDLLASIGLNERYLYANELFEGDMEVFKEAIQQLNQSDNYAEAINYCNEELKVKYGWEEENELYKALLTLIERRFKI